MTAVSSPVSRRATWPWRQWICRATRRRSGAREWVPGRSSSHRRGGVGQPPDRRWTAVVRPVVGTAAEVPTAEGPGAEFIAGAVNSSEMPERDLSVQLSGWMLMEAAHTVADLEFE